LGWDHGNTEAPKIKSRSQNPKLIAEWGEKSGWNMYSGLNRLFPEGSIENVRTDVRTLHEVGAKRKEANRNRVRHHHSFGEVKKVGGVHPICPWTSHQRSGAVRVVNIVRKRKENSNGAMDRAGKGSCRRPVGIGRQGIL